MMDRSSLAITRNNGGGSKNHPSSLQLQDGSAYRQAYSQNSGEQGGVHENVLPIVFVGITGVLVLLRLLCFSFRNDAAEEQEAGGGNRAGQPLPQPQLESSEAGGRRWADDTSTVDAVEVAPVQPAELPLVCTYRRADGWSESSCGVCLADLADGEDLRVLPACLHYFHAACVNEWLRGHDTCPLCRAPLVAQADTT